MSTEQMSNHAIHDQAIGYIEEPRKLKSSETQKVDINILMDRVREEKKKEKKENLIFLSLIASVIVVTGVIASL